MTISILVNNVKVEVPEGRTILHAAQAAGVKIPTLCYVEDRTPQGACRVCVVEVEGARNLQAACCTPATNNMRILTNTRRVREARRNIVELLLSEHEGDCQTCERNNDCELQELARSLGIDNVRFQGQKVEHKTDESTPALKRDSAKCIKCRRCVTVCNETQSVGAIFPQARGFKTTIGPAFDAAMDKVICVQCGQCTAVCPVGALTEKSQIDEVWQALDDPEKFVVAQTAPAIRAALGECFGYEPGTLVTGKMISALRQIGFDAVCDTNFTADLTIMEEGTEFLTRLKKTLLEKQFTPLPMFTSCCPAWIKFAEHYYPDLLPNLSTCKSPQQMFGAVAKTYFAEKIGKQMEDVAVVSVMPCTAKKFEQQRPEMNSSGLQDVDYVLTTRELARMIKQSGLDFNALPNGVMDSPLGVSTGAADIFANTGGVMEAALRTVFEIVTGREVPAKNLHFEPLMGLEGIKQVALKIKGTLKEWSFLEGLDVKVAVVHSLSNARKIIEAIRNGQVFHFVEVMACPGGCISGGGQPRYTNDTIRQKRIKAVYREDEGKQLRKSHANPEIKQIYEEFLGKPLGKKSHKLLHTHYAPRDPN